MKTNQSTTRRPAAKKAAKKRVVPKGYMGPKETQPLIMAAQEAFKFQQHLGNIDDGVKFDPWRREQIAFVVPGCTGFTQCQHEHYRPLMAHFMTLAGKDEKALELLMASGRVTGSGAKDDTREERETIILTIREALQSHIDLHDLAWPVLLDRWTAASKEAWKNSGELTRWPGLDSKWLVKAIDRKLAIEAHGGPIREAYLAVVARNKFKRPIRDLWPDLERLTVKQLRDLRSTLVNRINAKEGLQNQGRNKGQKTPAAREKRSKATLAPRHEQPAAALFDLPPQPRSD